MASKKGKQYGVVDVGSNSVRLSVYVRSEGDYPLRKVFDEKQVVGLSAYVNGGLLNDEGIRAASKVVKRQADHARLLGCNALGVFATAAMRNCSNSKAAVRMLSDMIGMKVDLISGPREAELGFAGIYPDYNLRKGYVADIGGGSTELSVVRKGKIAATKSLPFGSLSLWQANVEGLLPTEAELDVCCEQTRAELLTMDKEVFSYGQNGNMDSEDANAPMTLYGIGGTIRTAAKLSSGYLALKQEGSRNEGSSEVVTTNQLDELINFAIYNPDAYGHLLARTEPTRIHSVTPGLAVLRELLDWTGAQSVRRSKHGIREGYVLTCML